MLIGRSASSFERKSIHVYHTGYRSLAEKKNEEDEL